MILTDSIKQKIPEILDSKKYTGIHGVHFGYKFVNGERTNEIGIVFSVEKKVSENDLSQDHVLPKLITIDGEQIKTDVIESPMAKLLSCYASGDANLTRLRSFPTVPTPLKGGIEIRQFPTGWNQIPGGYTLTIGTLGFFAKDSIDGKVVGVTNAHVCVSNWQIDNDRNVNSEIANPNNVGEKYTWIVDGKSYYPSAAINGAGQNTVCFERIKRYEPIYLTQPNYVDCALLIPNPDYVDEFSYQVYQPIDQTTYPAALPFATTSELDNLLSSNPTVYCTGRTNGPIGWGTGDCKINITGVGVTRLIGEFGNVYTYSDQIVMQTPNNTAPMGGGDSGSCVMADIGGVRKIIGLMFAGSATESIFGRIDRIASEMNISAFTTPVNTSIPSANLYSASFDQYGSSKTISANGKTYYQIGMTKNVYP